MLPGNVTAGVVRQSVFPMWRVDRLGLRLTAYIDIDAGEIIRSHESHIDG